MEDDRIEQVNALMGRMHEAMNQAMPGIVRYSLDAATSMLEAALQASRIAGQDNELQMAIRDSLTATGHARVLAGD